ncbi:MAG: hypothetical protein ABIN37_07150 [Burkholderiaceae bacterium]
MRDPLQFHENPAAIAWWQNAMGRGLVWLTPPGRRRTLMSLAALGVGVVTTLRTMAHNKGLPVPTGALGLALLVLAQFSLLALVFWSAVRFAALPPVLRRHPQWALHGMYWGVLALLGLTTPSGGLWRAVVFGLAILFPLLIWRCGYLLMAGQHGRMQGSMVADHLFYLWPPYGGSNTPYGKGLAYLAQFEARSTPELARSQLAGLKLLLLAVFWRLVLTAFEGLVYGPGNGLTRALGGLTLGVATLPSLLAQVAPRPVTVSWASIYCALFEDVLRLAVKGHLIIGVLRLCGFNVFRNTYKPLLAESVVEFWNRYFYYFKELLSTFFFMPTFTGWGKRLRRWPNLRLAAAVFAAAFVGNVYYHVIKESEALAQGGWLDVMLAHRSRMFYCLLLALGIFVSMLREQRRRGQALTDGVARRSMRIFGVWTFFALISIWNADGGAPFMRRLGFAGGLLGLH